MSGASFLFLMTEGLDATVIDSQVVDGLAAVRREGVSFDLLSLADPRHWLRQREYYRRRGDEVAARTGGAVRVVPLPGKRGALGPLGAAALLLAERLRRGGRLVVHARTDYAASFASLASRLDPGIRYVFDCRGDGPSERRLEARQAGLSEAETQRAVERVERVGAAAASRASHVLVVSTVLRDRLVARHGIDAGRISVVPCVADADKFHLDEEDRRRVRRELGLEDRFVVVFPGRFGRWHYTEETCRVVRGLMDADPSVFFLILTPDLDAAADLARRLLLEGRYRIRSASHAEVPGFLRASDLGILLRAPDPLNEVACPTKFAEYVMTGLPVLISPGIGDCSGFVAEERAGAVLPEPDPARAVAALARIRAEGDSARRVRVAKAAERFARQRYAREMARLYRRLAEEP